MKIGKSLKMLSASTTAKTLATNFLYLAILKGMTFIIPLITLPYLAKVIGPDMFGAIAFASSIIVIFETITDWGFNYTATRDVSKNRENTQLVSSIYSEVLFAKTILMIGCLLSLLFLIYTIPSFKDYKLLLLLTFLYIPGNILFPQWLFQAYEQMKYITILSLISKLIFTLLVFVIIKTRDDYIFEPLLIACGFMVSGLLAQYYIFRSFKIKLLWPTYRSIIKRLKSSADMFLSLFLPNLYTNFTTIILKESCGNFATGIYNGGQKFQTIIDNLTQILSRTFFPYLARHKEKHHIYVCISGTIAIIGSLIMYFGANLFVKIFLTKEFEDAVSVMRVFAITPVFLFLMNTYGTNYLVIIGKENILRNIIIIVSIIGFGITWWLTPRFGYMGAAYTVTVVWGIRGAATWFYAKKLKGNI